MILIENHNREKSLSSNLYKYILSILIKENYFFPNKVFNSSYIAVFLFFISSIPPIKKGKHAYSPPTNSKEKKSCFVHQLEGYY